jgi:hypothetical protein
MTHTFGIEIETAGRPVQPVIDALRANGLRGFVVKPDGTPSVDAEIVLPPLPDTQETWDYVEKVCRVLQDIGCTINRSCGLHVHISNAPLNDGTSTAFFFGDSIDHTERTGDFLRGTYFADPMTGVEVKDIIRRYTSQQAVIDSMHPSSRTNNRYCQPLELGRIEAADNTVANLTRVTHGKFGTINLTTWSRGTLEFRQAAGTIEMPKMRAWVQFLLNLVEWTKSNRVTQGATEVTRTTPEQPFRRGARIGVIYTACRTQFGGATVQDLMDMTGTTAINIRARISEIRTRVGDAAIVTHTQQANGHSYGDGQDLARYEILNEWTEHGEGATLLPDNRIGIASIWAGLSDELYEFWQDRIIELRT